jgi:hypothetical protein
MAKTKTVAPNRTHLAGSGRGQKTNSVLSKTIDLASNRMTKSIPWTKRKRVRQCIVNNYDILILNLDRVDVSPKDNLQKGKEMGTNIDMKLSLNNEKKVSDKYKSSSSTQKFNGKCQGKEDININITITPGPSNTTIDIRCNTIEIKIRKRRDSKEPTDVKRKRKRTSRIQGIP